MVLSRGVRNNNPANIRRSATKWSFLKPVQSDKQFCQFIAMRYGIRAFFILMRTYRYKYGLKSPREIINRFAPASENDVDAYLNFLSSHMFAIDLPLNSDELYCLFAKYVFLYESNFKVSVSVLIEIMRHEKCSVINNRKECYEASLF